MSITQKRVLVIGAGYGGLRAIEKLAQNTTLDITLIDKNAYHYLQTEAYGYIAGRFDIRDIVIDLEEWCAGFIHTIQFLQGEVTTIDYEHQNIQTKDTVVGYDYLILATGAQTNFFLFISGLETYSHGIKTLQRAYEFRRSFEDLIYKKLEHSSCETFNLVIGGAGLSGVEVAAEMAYIIQNYSKTIGENTNTIQIYLIDASESILPGMDQYLIDNTYKRLEDLGVKILINTFIDKVDDTHIYFKNNEYLEYYFMVFTGGILAQTFETSLAFKKNRLNQYKPNKKLHINGYSNVFGIGDCIEISDEKGNIVAPTAQLAEISAEYVVDAIAKDIEGNDIEEFNARLVGIFIALGGSYAVGNLYKYIKVKGFMAYLLKKFISYSYKLGLHLRINTGFKNRIRAGPT